VREPFSAISFVWGEISEMKDGVGVLRKWGWSWWGRL
jgi:hypothetical protein